MSLYDTKLHMPMLVLAVLLGRTNRRIVQMVKEYNVACGKEDPSAVIHLKGPNHLSDGTRPSHRGHPADYLSVVEALQLVTCALRKVRKRPLCF